jgi:hypothetical protein
MAIKKQKPGNPGKTAGKPVAKKIAKAVKPTPKKVVKASKAAPAKKAAPKKAVVKPVPKNQ